MTIRGNIARRRAGGPQFRLEPGRILVEVSGESSLSEVAENATEARDEVLDEPLVSGDRFRHVESKLNEIGFEVKRLENFGTLVASAERLSDVAENIANARNTFNDKTVKRVKKAKQRAKNGSDKTIVGGFKPGMFNFGQEGDASLEAKLRNQLSSMDLHNSVTDAIEDIDGVLNAEISFTRNTPGPRNLGVDPDSRPTISSAFSDEKDDSSSKPDVGDALEKMGVDKAWKIGRGENAVVAIFDTAFCAEYLDSDRVIDTFSGPDVESAFSAPEEGHGTMTAYSTAGNKEESGLDYNGVAPEADLLLARLSDSSGALAYTEEAWDWLARWIKRLDRPVISNHSYGVPLCSGRSMDLCNATTTKIAEVMNKREDHQAFYAAGNEAIYCGHRLAGYTNGINGVNSKPSSITVGALRYDLQDAQNYSSHGYGTCNSVNQNPKPDVSCLLPSILPYGCKEKDMSSGNGGSSGGTSEATPLTAGVATLMASLTGRAKQSELEGLLESTAKMPRTTQVNAFRGHDARFGHGQVRAEAAVAQAAILQPEEPPNAVFTFGPKNPQPGEEVNFNASASTDPEEDIEEYRWQFGDGTTGEGELVSHTYDEPSEYRVVLKVTDSAGNQTTATQTVNVEAPKAEEGEENGEDGEGDTQSGSISGPLGILGN